MTTFAAWLQAELDARGWDQRDAARYFHVRESAVHNWLHQGRIPQTKSIIKIAIGLDKPAEEVMRAAGIDVPTHATEEERASDEAQILATHPGYREIIRMIARKPLDQQQTYLTLIKRLLAE